MNDELDMTYKGKSARVFGKLWGTMRDIGLGDKIDGAKQIIRPALDRGFKHGDIPFEDASEEFLDVVLDYLDVSDATVSQIKLMELAVDDALSFNFDEDRGNA